MITAELQKLSTDNMVVLYELDTTLIGGTEVFRFHNGVNALGGTVVWDGQDYERFPIEASGFERTGSGSMPRPKLAVANIDGLIGALIREVGGLEGSKLTRIRTFLKYLDAVNFGGVNPTADPTQFIEREVFYLNRKSSENRIFIEYELASAMDLAGVKIPRRQIIQNICTWGYRSPECSWVTVPKKRNLLLNTEAFENTWWSKTASGTGVAPVVTANQAANPINGAVNADRVVFNKGAGATTTDASNLSANGTIATVAGQPYVQSFWARSFDGVSSYTFRADFNGADGAPSSLITITPTWQRFVISLASAIDASRRPILRLRGSLGTSNSADILLWGFQFENAAAVSDYQAVGTAYPTTNYFDADDQPTSNYDADKCGQRLSSCKARFGEYAILPFGGFPGAGLTR